MRKNALSPLLLAAVLVPAAGIVPAHAATPKPNLTVTRVAAIKPATLAAGAALTVRDTTAAAKATGGSAPASTTRYYLTTDGATSLTARRSSTSDPRAYDADQLLAGARSVPRLKAGAASTGRAKLMVPSATPAGSYRLLACADDRAQVAESREGDNCTLAGPVKVTAATDTGPLAAAFSSFDDQLPLLPDNEIATRLPAYKGLGCTPPVAARAFRTAKAAIASARASLTVQAGAAAMTAFAASPEAQSVDAARGAALGLVTTGNLGGALVAQLRAAELAPNDRDVLVNTAALATSAGLPNEAIALLDQARRADAPAALPGGPDRRAVAAQVRAMADLQLGKTADAGKLLAAVPALDGNLAADAASGEANAALCANDLALGVAKLKRAAKRTPPTTPGQPPAVVPLDDSRGGHATTLRPLALPANPQQAYASLPHYVELENQVSAEIDTQNQAEAAVNARLRARAISPAQERREDLIQDRVNDVVDRPAIKAIQQEEFHELDEATKVDYAMFGNAEQESKHFRFQEAAQDACAGTKGDYDTCVEEHMRQTCTPEVRSHHQLWLAHMQHARDAGGRWVATMSTAMTGLAANAEDPDFRESVMLQVRAIELTTHAFVLGELQGWAHYTDLYYDTCVKPPQGMPAQPASNVGTDGNGAYPGPDPCNAVSKQFNVTLDVSKLVTEAAIPKADVPLPKLPKIKVNCERIQVSYEFGPSAWAQPFAQVDWKFRAGTVTAFVGVRGKVEFAAHNEQMKAGFYLTGSKNGVQDFGYRMSESTTRPLGPIFEVTSKADWDLSFVPAFQDLGALVRG